MIGKKFLTITIGILFVILAGCLKDDFVEIDGVCPVVISTIPTNGEINVPLDQIISVNFNEEMDPTTITGTSLTIDGPTSVQGTISYSGTTATFVPNVPLLPNTTYTGKVKTTVKDKKGNALQTDYIWTFSTGAVLAPLVLTTDPANLEVNVTLNKIITATFNMPMDGTTFNNSTFYISLNGNKIAGNVSLIGSTASFTPLQDLIANTTYTGFISSSVQNTVGTSLGADYTWTFTTGSLMAPMVIATDPTNNEVNVELDKIITATFSEPMNAATITNSSFVIRNGASIIGGTVTYAGVTATFTPTTPLIPGTVYTGTITTAAKNLVGTPLTNNYVWTFSTSTGISPIVISTDPANNATAVPLDKIITATFNVVMDPSTINDVNFTLKNGAVPVKGVVTYSGTTATFTPAENLLASVTYTASISNLVKSLAGTFMENTYTWTFSTGVVIAPTVIATDPTDNDIDVSLNKTVTATFSMQMNPSTINNNTFTLFRGSTQVTGTITYSGNTASFNPTVDLIPGAIYTATITNGVQNVAGTAMTNNYVWSFTTGAVIAPTVISTDPLNNATNVSLNQTVTATFSMPMNPATINTNTFTLFRGTTQVDGVVTYSGTTASFNPSLDLIAGAIYTATITNSVTNVAGTAMVNNYVWSFTTGAGIAPTVISTDPLNNATNVSLNKTVTATFSMPMNPATFNTNTFTLFRGTTQVAGVVTYNGTTASFDPLVDLMAGAIYTATITNSVTNVAGTAMVNNYVWSFTTSAGVAPTVISTDPLNNATNVSLNKTVTATFSMPMNPATINTGTFTLFRGATPVAGVVTYSGTTASFNPLVDLIAGAIYTATITNSVTNVAGTAMTNNYVWSFTTSVAVPPTVISTVPTNNAINVNVGQNITATFSEAMNPGTINSNTFILQQNNNNIAGVITYSGTTATFNPTVSLLPNTIYTVTITTGAQNVAGVSLANNYVWTFTTAAPNGPAAINLGSASEYGILAGVGVSNNAGFSQIINMNVGISPGVRSSVTGFPPAVVINGAIHASDDATPPGIAAILANAKSDLSNAYYDAEGATTPAPALVSGDIGGTTLAPGIYKTNSTLLIQSGDLTLDAQGNPDAVWIFQVASGFTTIGGAGGSVILSGGALARNVFWQVGSSATIGDGTSFEGNVLALTSITMNSGATVTGRMLCINGSVVMTNTNFITRP